MNGAVIRGRLAWPQITQKGVDLHGTHTQHPGVYGRGLGNASSSRWHGISHRFTWVHTRGRGRGEKGDLPMKRTRYGERDYAFGQLMLTLRTQLGLTQASLAQQLRVSRRAVSTWELGSNYPASAHLKQLIVLGMRASAFPAGHEEEEIRALWRAAHQKVLLDEPWLQGLLGTRHPRLALVAPQSDEQAVAQPARGPRVDWGDALDVPAFYGREEELALLSQWVAEARCRVVSVLGMGGIGKSALAVTAMHRLAAQFEVVIFRSLRDAPACSALVEGCLQVLAPNVLRELPDSLEERLRLLMEQLRARRGPL